MRKRQRPMTVLEVATRRTGSMRKGMHVMTYFLEWHLAAAELGRRDFLMDDLAPVIGKSRAQAFRDQALFREVFPDHSTPGDLAESVHNTAVRDWADAIVAAGRKASAGDLAGGMHVAVLS